jgi:hypothetical protein
MTYPNPSASTPPVLLAINTRYVVTGGLVPSDGECAIVLTAAGVGAIVSLAGVFAPPAAATAWGCSVCCQRRRWRLHSLADCYNQYEITKPAWDVITQCPVNQPHLTSTFDDWGKATAYVNLDSCFCSLSCQWGFEDAPGSTGPSSASGRPGLLARGGEPAQRAGHGGTRRRLTSTPWQRRWGWTTPAATQGQYNHPEVCQ